MTSGEFTTRQVRRDLALADAIAAELYVMIGMMPPPPEILEFAQPQARRVGTKVAVLTPA